MLGQPFRLLSQTVGIEPFAGFDDAGVQGTAPLLQQTAIGHLVGEGVLEGVFELGEEAGFVEELGCLQVAETAAQFLLGQLYDSLQEGKGHLRTDDRCGLEEALLLGRQAVDAGRQDCLHRGGGLHALKGALTGDRRHACDEHPGFHQGPDALFQEERDCRSVRSIKSRLSGTRLGSPPIRACSSSSALAGSKGSSRSCV